MLLQEYLSETHGFATPEQWGVVQRSVPQQWVEQALKMSGFYSAGLLWPLQHQQGRHWLIPARAGLKGEVVQTHGPGDVQLRMKVSLPHKEKAAQC
jgi:hypothetical protein